MDNNVDEWKVFICHASEDKEEVAEQLALELKKFGLNVWYDNHSILLGDEIDNEVFIEGLNKTRYAIVIFSKKFYKKIYPQYESGVLMFKKCLKHNVIIIPFIYKINIKTVKNKSPFFYKYKGISINNNKNLNIVANKINTDIKNHEIKFNKIKGEVKGTEVRNSEEVEKEWEKEKQKKIEEVEKEWKKILTVNNRIKYTAILLGIAAIITILLLFQFYKKDTIKPVQEIIKTDTAPNDSQISNTYTESTNQEKTIKTSELNKEKTDNNITNLQIQQETDYSSYVNSSYTNSKDIIEVSVLILDSSNNIENSVSSSIADIYIKAGMKGNIGLLNRKFILLPEFQDLVDGNFSIINKMKLNKYTDYLAIGKISYLYEQDKDNKEKTYCTASITMNIISTNNEPPKSFTVSGNGNGASKKQAHEYALRNLLGKYINEHSSF